MAWLARSIANSLLAPEEDESTGIGPGPSASPGSSPSSPPRGVREDLSELTGALANRFQGLASFLAPAAPGGGAPRRPDPAEIAGRFRAGLARLPGRQAVADLAKIASSLLPPEGGDADWDEDAVGVTEEVVAFARDAALRHELWLDFPLLPDDADSDGSCVSSLALQKDCYPSVCCDFVLIVFAPLM
jgi:hypothetical protein